MYDHFQSEKEEIEFAHVFFIRGQEHLLEQIKRKSASNSKSQPGLAVPGIKKESVFIAQIDNSDKEEMVNEILVEMSQMKERQEDLDNKMENMKSENEVLRQKYTQQQKIIEDAQNSDNRKRKKYNFHSRYQNKVMPLPTTLERMTFSGLSSYLSKLLKQELQNTGQTGKGTGQQFRWGDSRLKIQ